MTTSIIKERENDFTKTHCTDALFDNIVQELSSRKEGTKGSRKINLTPEMLRDFLYHVSVGKQLKVSAELAGINEKTRQDYNSRSSTFSGAVSLAQNNIESAAMEAVYKAIVGTKPGYYQLTHPATGNLEYIHIKETVPNVQVAMWLLEKRKVFGSDDDSSQQPQLGAPRNEEEAALLEMLLNKHYDYVKAKENTK